MASKKKTKTPKPKPKVKPKPKGKRKPGRPKGTSKPRATKWEKELRVDDAEKMLLEGMLRGNVRKALMESYQIGYDQADKYIACVYARWATAKRPGLKSRLTSGIRRRLHCYSKALASGDHHAAHRHLSELEKMEGIAGPIETFEGKVVIEGGDKPVEVEAGEGLKALIGKLFATKGRREKLAKGVSPPRKEGKRGPPKSKGK